jgi:hypothetical protein
VLAQYLFRLANTTATPWQQKGAAVAAYTVAALREYFHAVTPHRLPY